MKKVVLLTNADRGQANVFFAVAEALLRSHTDVEVHFATFGVLESEVCALGNDVSGKDQGAGRGPQVYFHPIIGLSMEESLRRLVKTTGMVTPADHFLPQSYLVPLGTRNTMRAIRDTTVVFVPYEGPQLGKVFSSIVDILTTVNPDLVLVDALMTAGLTACYHLGVNFHCLSPNSITEFARPSQPRAAALWRYPALFSGHKFPVPLHQIPLNIFFNLYAIYALQNNTTFKEAQAWMAQHANVRLRTPIDLLRDRPANVQVLIGTLQELDFPVDVVPSHIRPCGPILRQTGRPVEADDADLAAWLAKGPTIYINMGSICRLSEDQACELAAAIKIVLQTTPSSCFQVLWKLNKLGSYQVREPGSRVYNVLVEGFKLDLVRVYDWLVPEPTALLETGHVVCSIHHGGANSYYDAISAGVPQVVLPQWTDCYDYAQRVEHLGVGRMGSRKIRPLWTAQELAGELLTVLVGKQASTIKRRAKELSRLCRHNGNGALKVVEFITQELQLSKELEHSQSD